MSPSAIISLYTYNGIGRRSSTKTKYHFMDIILDKYLLHIVAERSKASVYGRSLAGIADSNPAGGMDVCLL